MPIVKSPQCFYRLLTPDVLVNKHRCESAKSASSALATLKLDDTPLLNDMLLFRVPLVKEGDLGTPNTTDPPDYEHDPPADLVDLTINVNVGMRYRVSDRSEPYDPKTCPRITFLVVEAGCVNEDGALHGLGFQVRDPREFEEWGPYRGVEARVLDTAPTSTPPDDLHGTLSYRIKPSYLPDDRGDLGGLEPLRSGTRSPRDLSPQDIPERYEMTIKPYAWWGRCASSLQGGHTVSVAPYFGSIDVTTGLYLDIYGRKPGKNFYDIKFVEVSIHC